MTPWLATLLGVGLPMLLIALLNGRSIATFDNYGIQMTAASLILDGKTDFSRLAGVRTEAGNKCEGLAYPAICHSHEMQAATPAGVLLFLVPSFALARLVGADLANHQVIWRLSKWTAALLTGGMLTLFFLIGLRIAGLRAAVAGSLFLGLGSAVWSTLAQGMWSHDGVAFGLILGLWALFLQAPRHERFAGVWIGIAWTLMIASRNSSAPIIFLFAIWLLPRPRLFLPAALTGLVGLGLVSLYYQAVYGSFLGPQVAAVTGGGEPNAYALSIFPEGLYGLLLSPGTGLFVYQIWLVYLLLPARKAHLPVSSHLPRHWKKALLVMGVSQLLVYSFFMHWDGQWCWGTRYLSEVIPALALVLLPGLASRLHEAKGRKLALALGAIAFLIHLNGTALAGNQWHHHPLDAKATLETRSLDWSDPPFLYPIPRWFR